MLNNKKVVVVMPAYNAQLTLARTVSELDRSVVDEVIVVDDCSSDATVRIARELGLPVRRHHKNLGYGANQKTCYSEALALGADIVVMVHPDYQYSPKLVTALASMLAYGEYDFVMASRILGRGAIKGGMPRYKYIANRVLTLTENLLVGDKFSEYHSGFRAFTREVLTSVDFTTASDDFVFDNQLILQILHQRFRVGEISCPTRYAEDSSSIDFRRSVNYGLGVLTSAASYRLHRHGITSPKFLQHARRAEASSHRTEGPASSTAHQPGLVTEATR